MTLAPFYTGSGQLQDKHEFYICDVSILVKSGRRELLLIVDIYAFADIAMLLDLILIQKRNYQGIWRKYTFTATHVHEAHAVLLCRQKQQEGGKKSKTINYLQRSNETKKRRCVLTGRSYFYSRRE